MKKILFTTLIVSSLFTGFAQQGLHLGAKIIPQSVWLINGDNSDDPSFIYENAFRVAYGFNLAYHFNNSIGLGVDLIVSPQGQQFRTCDGCESQLRKTNYFKLPLLLHWNGDPEKVGMFVGYFGPQLAISTSASLGDIDLSEGFTTYFGLALGVGAGFNLTDFLVLTTMLRLDAGLTDPVSNSFVPTDAAKSWPLTGGLEVGLKYVLRTGN